jgi:IMP cyclohydrolase
MAYKILGQLAAAATTEEALYAVPASSSTVVSSIVIANRGATSATYRLAVKPTAATTLATNHYLAYDVAIAANDSVALTLGVTLAATNAIRTYASNTNLTFTAFGSEN